VDKIKERARKLKKDLMAVPVFMPYLWLKNYDDLIIVALQDQDAESRKLQRTKDAYALESCPGFGDPHGHWCVELSTAQKVIMNAEVKE